MKKVLLFVIIFTMLLPLTAFALEPGEGADFYVYDEPGVLSESTRQAIYELNGQLEEQYGAQLVIVFLNYFGSTDPDELAVSLFNDWQVSDYGMLLVASVKEQAGSMTVGSKITGRFTSSDINSYLDKYFAGSFFDGKYDDAVTKLAARLGQWYEGEFGGSVTVTPEGSEKPAMGWFAGFILNNLFLILLILALVFIIIRNDRRRYRGYYAGLGMPVPRYYPWYIFMLHRPYHSYRPPAPPHGATFYHTTHRPQSYYRPQSSQHRPQSHSGSGSFSSHSSGFRPRGGGMGGRSGGSVGGFRK